MYDISAVVSAYIQALWTETDPAISDLKFTYDEFDPNACYPQILFTTGIAKFTFMTRNIQKVEQQLVITIFLRPVKYMPDVIAKFKTTFLNMKTEIKDILNEGRFDVTPIYSVQPVSWEDVEFGVGRTDLKTSKEPIVFTAVLKVNCVFFEGTFRDCDITTTKTTTTTSTTTTTTKTTTTPPN